MKLLISLSLFLMPGFCLADTFVLKDGTKLEGEVTGEMEGVLMVRTKYGALTISKADIKEQQAAPAPAPAVSTAPAVAASTAAPAPAEPQPPKLTFAAVQPSTSTRLLVYSENGVAIATETFNAAGELASLEGAIKDGTYTEYYENGGLKTVKTLSGGKASGTLKAFYPNGAVQIEAYYLAGAKDGAFKYFAEDGKQLMEASYKDDKLNGWKKEFDASGAVKSEAYYADDHLTEPPKPQVVPEQLKEPESMVTAKPMKLARGERFTFQLNGKYLGKATLDNDFNIIGLEGNVPDGAVKVYTKDGKLDKEFIFQKNEIVLLRVYGPVSDSVSALDFTVLADSKYDKIVNDLSAAGAALKDKTVALIPFLDSDEKANKKNANIISERILTKLIKQGTFKIVERNLLDKVLGELKLQASGVIDSENTKKLGKVLGVEAIITGTVAETARGEIDVNARLINVETAQAIGASRITLDKTGATQKSGEYLYSDGKAVKKKL